MFCTVEEQYVEGLWYHNFTSLMICNSVGSKTNSTFKLD